MIVEELPLFRAKVSGFYGDDGTGSAVGPGSYNIQYKSTQKKNGTAPFGSTSVKFFPQATSTTPGVGTYVLPPADNKKGDITIVPFASNVDRFFRLATDNFPGPGQYLHDGDGWGRSGRSHTMGMPHPKACDKKPLPGPGSYKTDCSAKARANPRAAEFGKYSGREAPRYNDVPGPGHYDQALSDKSVYDKKPSFMFATKTERTPIANSINNSALGAYNLPSMFMSPEEYRALNPESFSAFGSSAPRFTSFGSNNNPGPGAYTGEIAPRRPHKQQKGKGTSSFTSQSNRNTLSPGTNLGPGAYDFTKPVKHPRYQLASVPFRSSSTRFPAAKPVEEERHYKSRRPVVQVPRRVHPLRLLSETAKYSPNVMPKSDLPDCFYDVKYDWPKPVSTSASNLGSAPRFDSKDPRAAFPGPGHYDVVDKTFGRGRLFNGTSWGTDGRFKREPQEYTPGPGHYANDSTFYKKSFNCTIGSTEDM